MGCTLVLVSYMFNTLCISPSVSSMSGKNQKRIGLCTFTWISKTYQIPHTCVQKFEFVSAVVYGGHALIQSRQALFKRPKNANLYCALVLSLHSHHLALIRSLTHTKLSLLSAHSLLSFFLSLPPSLLGLCGAYHAICELLALLKGFFQFIDSCLFRLQEFQFCAIDKKREREW